MFLSVNPHSRPRFATFVVVDKYTGKVHSEHVTRGEARGAKSALPVPQRWSARVRGGKRMAW